MLYMIKYKNINQIMGQRVIDTDLWEATCAMLGYKATFDYVQSLLRHIRCVRQFANDYYPEIQYLTAVHDFSKFGPQEFEPYARNFYGVTHGAEERPDEYMVAWKHHYTMNPHHWQFWAVGLNKDFPDAGIPRTMPEEYAKEMICDWHGAAEAYGGKRDIAGWLNGDDGRAVKLSHRTRAFVWSELSKLGYVLDGNLDWRLEKEL